MKKILWLIFLCLIINKVDAKVYYSEYSKFSPFQEEEVTSSDTIDVIKEDNVSKSLPPQPNEPKNETNFALGFSALARMQAFAAIGWGPARTMEAPINMVAASTILTASSPKSSLTKSWTLTLILFFSKPSLT